MTTLSIQPPFPIFTDRDGQPLENGYVWVGSANLNPITNPIAVYWDAALTQPASQPVRTINGYPANNGTPARLYVNSDYSIQVQDAKGSLVYSALATTDRFSDVVVSGVNASNVIYQPSGAGAVVTNVQDALRQRISAFNFMTAAEIASVQARDMVHDVTVPLQAFFDACRGKRGFLPAGTYKKTAQITLDPQYSYDIEGDGWSSEFTEQGSIIKDTTNGNGLFIYYTLAASGAPAYNSDNRVRLARFSLRGPATTNVSPGTQTIVIEGVSTVVQTGTGIWMYWTQGLLLEDVWISDYPGDGIYGYRCFSSAYRNVWLIKNRNCGIHLFKTANSVQLSGIKALGNGRVGSSAINCNILIDGASSFENLGPIIDGANDVSYGGNNGYAGFKLGVAAATLSNVTVLSGTATINATGHGFAAGNKIAIYGATGADAQINTVAAATVLTTAANSFTVATTAADGTYNQSTLKVGPYVAGIGIANIQGIQIDPYSEECSGPAVYVYDTVTGFTVRGGYYLDNKVYVESLARGGSIRGCAFTGNRAGVYLVDSVSAVVGENQYLNDALRGMPSSYIGGLPFLDNGSTLVQGLTIGRGADLNFNERTPGDVTNTAIGVATLRNASTAGGGGQGKQNTALGYYALSASTAGYNNTAVGRHTALSLTTGFNNVAVGNRAMDTGTNIQEAVFVGNAAGSGTTSGGNDTYVGAAAGSKASAGASDGNNTGVGSNALRVDGSQTYKWCTVVGGQDTPMSAVTGLTNYTAIGYNTWSFAASNKVRVGDANVTAAHVQVAWTVTSDARLKRDVADLDLGLDFVKSLRPVSFKRIDGDDTEELGFIAQEVQSSLPRPLGLLSVDADGTYMLRKDDLLAVLVKAVQELTTRVKELEDARA